MALAIIALMTGAAYLTLRPDTDPAQRAAAQLQLDLARAETLAVTRGEIIGLDLSADGYQFLLYADGGWHALPRRAALEDRQLPDGVTLSSGLVRSLVVDPEAPALPDYWFDPTGANEALSIRIESRTGRWRVETGGVDGIRLVAGDGV